MIEVQFLSHMIPVLLLALGFLFVATYLLRYHATNRLALGIGVAMGASSIGFFFDSLRAHPLNPEAFTIIVRLHLLVIAFTLLVMFYVIILFREREEQRTLTFQRKLVWFVFIPYLLINLFLFLFTNLHFDAAPRIIGVFDEYYTYAINKTLFSLITVIYQLLITLIAFYNVFKVYKLSTQNLLLKKNRFIMFVSTLLVGMGGLIANIFHYLEDTRLIIVGDRDSFILFYRILFVTALAFYVYGFLRLNTFIKEGKALLLDVVIDFATSICILIIYIIPLYLIITFTSEPDTIPLLFASFPMLIIITHHFFDIIKDKITQLFESKLAILLFIDYENVNYAVKNYNNSKELSKSHLLKLESVKIIQKKFDLNPTKALQRLLDELLESLKPGRDEFFKRTKKTLQHQILSMVIKQQAVESQILWNLGFNSRSVINNLEKPLYPVKRNSEYTGVSIISYKRLRKQAIENMTWSLLQRERKMLRLF